jgi:class 3 adenylate cyclase
LSGSVAVVELPQTRYAKSGDVSVAYQVFGRGPPDLVFVPPHVSNVELVWEISPRAAGMRLLAEFSRVITFDKRGTGLSDRMSGVPSLEDRMDDVRAVMDAVGSSRAALLGVLEGGPMSILFAATYPDRCLGLALFASFARAAWAPDHSWRPTAQEFERAALACERAWGTRELIEPQVASLYPNANAEEREGLIETFSRFNRQSASPGAAAALERMNAEIDVREVLSAIRVPTTVFVPKSAPDAAQRDAAFLADSIPTAQLVELDDNGGLAFFSGDLDLRTGALRRFLADAARQSVTGSERMLVTVLFTDLIDSTARAVEIGDRAWRDLLSRHHERVRVELARFRGRELDTAGDGFFAAFDGPARAIRCACAIQESVNDLGLELRAGLHTGECEQMNGKIAGIAVATGARIAALGNSGDVLVSATVRDLVAGSGITFEDRGVHALKGMPEARHVFAVSRPQSPQRPQ